MTLAARFEDGLAERRDDGRRTLRLGVTAALPGGQDAVTVHNISATGMLIETAAALAEGDSFALDLPEAGEQIAQVVWADAPMFGCRFAAPLGAAALAAAQLRGDAPWSASAAGSSEDFGRRLHRLRRERGLSLGEIAARLGVSKPTVWAWEHGKSRPVERRMSALADVLGVAQEGLQPTAKSGGELVEGNRRAIAQAYGVDPSRVRIMIEL